LNKKSAIAAGVGPSPTCSIGAASVAASRHSITDGRFRLRWAPDDLRRASHAEQLDKTGHLVEQVSISIFLTGFAQDYRGYEPWGEILKPTGVQ